MYNFVFLYSLLYITVGLCFKDRTWKMVSKIPFQIYVCFIFCRCWYWDGRNDHRNWPTTNRFVTLINIILTVMMHLLTFCPSGSHCLFFLLKPTILSCDLPSSNMSSFNEHKISFQAVCLLKDFLLQENIIPNQISLSYQSSDIMTFRVNIDIKVPVDPQISLINPREQLISI